MSLSVVILAAGQGTRMKSRLPKVLHRLAGRPLLEHVYSNVTGLGHDQVVIVYGYGGRAVPEALPFIEANWVEQSEQLGTGHAVAQAAPLLGDSEDVLILYGDVPLTSNTTLKRLLAAASDSRFALLTARLPDPTGYGRVVRNNAGEIVRIAEHRDASAEERAIHEINTGMMVVRSELLKRWLSALDNGNSQGEYYLTDIIAMAADEKIRIESIHPQSHYEIAGINDRVQLAAAEQHYRRLRAEEYMLAGTTIVDPQRFDLRGNLEAGSDVVIDINVILEGDVKIGNDVRIGANCILSDVEIDSGTEVKPNSIIEKARIGSDCCIGPFARIRPDTYLENAVHIGNFVEVKKTSVGSGSKINHLSYIGDTEIGRDTNIGAGTITCNYDGANKHKTVIGNAVFIGSDTQLVAPVRIADGATVGAGTTVTRDVDSGCLAVSRSEQRSVKHWRRPGQEGEK